MNKEIFKYGPPMNLITAQQSSRNTTYTSTINNTVKNFINNSVSTTINNTIVQAITNNLTNIINESDTFISNIENIVNNSQNITNIFQTNIPLNIKIDSIALSTTAAGKISVLDNIQFNSLGIFGNADQFSDLTNYVNYGIVTNK